MSFFTKLWQFLFPPRTEAAADPRPAPLAPDEAAGEVTPEVAAPTATEPTPAPAPALEPEPAPAPAPVAPPVAQPEPVAPPVARPEPVAPAAAASDAPAPLPVRRRNPANARGSFEAPSGSLFQRPDDVES